MDLGNNSYEDRRFINLIKKLHKTRHKDFSRSFEDLYEYIDT